MAVDTIYLKNEQGADVPYQIGADSRNVTYSPNAETVEGSVHKELQQNNIHKNTIIANDTGVHGIRYKDNKLQVQAPGGGWNPIDFGTGDMKKADYDDPNQDGVISIAHGGTGNTSGYVRAGAFSNDTMGDRATAEGFSNLISGANAHGGGDRNVITNFGTNSMVQGSGCKVTRENSFALGSFIQIDSEQTLAVGSGTTAGGAPILGNDCVNKVDNENGITAINGLDGKYKDKVPIG